MTDQLTGQRLGGALGALARELPTDRLRAEAQNLLAAFGERTFDTLVDKAEHFTGRLTEYAESGGTGPGLKAVLAGGRSLVEGKSPLRALAAAGLSGAGGALGQLKDKAVSTLTGGRGGGGERSKKLKVVNIVEDIDVGVPVSVAYRQWTQFEDFPTFMKKVEDVSTASETELDWKAQVFWSHRTWHSTVVDQVPDERIVWKSKGEKGHVDGAVTFHELTPDLTRILLVLQYYPQGFFERTGNIWRAQGRRARLELKHFRRHVMTHTLLSPDEAQGWQGEVHDGEVVRTDEEVREERAEKEPAGREHEYPEDEREDGGEYGLEDEEDRAYEDEEGRAYEDAEEAEEEPRYRRRAAAGDEYDGDGDGYGEGEDGGETGPERARSSSASGTRRR